MSTGVTKTPSDVGAPPRVVRLKRKMRWVVVVCVVFLAAPLVLVVLGGIQLYVLANGAPITATVDGTHVTHGKHTNYYVDYDYMLDGADHTDSQSVNWQTYDDTSEGQIFRGKAMKLWGHYFSETELSDVRAGAMKGLAIAGVWIVVLLGIGWQYWIRRRFLVQNGTAIASAITDKTIVRGKSSAYFIHFTFEAREGGSFSGKTVTTRKNYDQAQVGQMITVIYDPMKPKRNMAYEYCDFEVVKG